VWALGTLTNDAIKFPDETFWVDQTMPEGTDGTLDNCDLHDIYEVKKYNCSFFFLLLNFPLLLSDS